MVKVDVKKIIDRENSESFSVRAEVCSDEKCLTIRHSYPDDGYHTEKVDGVPRYVKDLKEIFEEKVEDTPEKPEKTYKL